MTNKDLISQYVDTGLQLPKYQLDKLSSQDIKTYIRKRLIASQENGQYKMYKLDRDEFKFLPPKFQREYALYYANFEGFFRDSEFKLLSPEVQREYLDKLIEFGKMGTVYQFSRLSPDEKKELAINSFNSFKEKESSIPIYLIPYLPSDLEKEWAKLMGERIGGSLYSGAVQSLSPEAMAIYINKRTEFRRNIETELIKKLPENVINMLSDDAKRWLELMKSGNAFYR